MKKLSIVSFLVAALVAVATGTTSATSVSAQGTGITSMDIYWD